MRIAAWKPELAGDNGDGPADSIWLKTGEEELRSVYSKKLERAEKLRQKNQQKKDAAGLKPVANKYGSRKATASQVQVQGAGRDQPGG